MDMNHDQLRAIQTWAASEPLIKEVFLFGSRAKGTARPDSDTDLALLLDVELHEVDRYFGMNGEYWQRDLRDRAGLEINLAHLGGEKTPIHNAAVADHGVKLYPLPTQPE